MLLQKTDNETKNQADIKHKHILFYVCMSLFWGTLVLKNLIGLNIPVFVFLVYAMIISILGDRDEMIALAASCIPFLTSMQYKYILFIITVVYILKFKRDFKGVKFWTIFGVFIIFWEGLHFVTLGFSVIDYIRSFAELIFCMVIFVSDYRNYNFSLIRRILALSTAVVCSIILFNMVKEATSLDEFFYGYYRFGESIEETESYSGTFNPNQLGFICNFAIVGLLQQIYAREEKPIDYILIPVLAFYGLITLSRTFIICFALLIITFTLARAKSFLKTFVGVASVGAGLSLLFVLFMNWFPTIYNALISRWESEDISNGRLDLLVFFHKHITSSFYNLFFGIGIQNVGAKLLSMYGTSMPPHNGIQEILVIWGIPGVILVVCWIWLFIRGAKQYNQKMLLMNFLPFILILVDIQFGQFFRSGTVMLSMPIAFISLYQIFAIRNEKNFSDGLQDKISV